MVGESWVGTLERLARSGVSAADSKKCKEIAEYLKFRYATISDFDVAQLRHAYTHLVNGTVTNQKEFARGLLGPVIEKLERSRQNENSL